MLLLAVAGAVAVAPLAPVGPVRAFDAARGLEADPLVLAGGGALTVILLGILTALAWRLVRPAASAPASGQPGVTGWPTFGFTQVPIDGQNVPALGLTRHLGAVEPPTTSGRPISGPLQIELGTTTLRAPRVLGAAIVNAAQMGGQPLALALAAAVLSLAVTLLASVRQCRPELALLKALGLTRRPSSR
jgi:hypothetical protein